MDDTLTVRYDAKELQTATEAAEWLLRLDEDSSASCRSEFAAWLRHSPQHMEEFLLLSATARNLQGIDPEHGIDVEALLKETPLNVVSLQSPPPVAMTGMSPDVRRSLWHHWKFAAAAVFAAVVAVPLLLMTTIESNGYETGIGEQRSVQMEDGSLVHLNTRTRVEVNYTAQAREVRLLEGEALFAVAQDAVRPFRVMAGTAVIQAIGTEFNVYRRGNDTRVSVVEGRVQLMPFVARDSTPSAKAPPLLGAGEEAQILEDGRILRQAPRKSAEAVAWRERRLVFEAERLDIIAAEFNRYSRVPIRVEGAAAERQLTGTFNAGDPGAFLRFLEDDETLDVRVNGTESVVRVRR
jgi:transmembrane sensor